MFKKIFLQLETEFDLLLISVSLFVFSCNEANMKAASTHRCKDQTQPKCLRGRK